MTLISSSFVKLIDSKILPLSKENKEKHVQLMETFKKNALSKFSEKSVSNSKDREVEITNDYQKLTENQKKVLEQVYKDKFPNNIPGVKIIKGGLNHVIFLDDFSGYVFKPFKIEKFAKSYCENANKGAKIITEKKLFLLNIPPSIVVPMNGFYYVMQKKVDLINGNYYFQKGIYSYCWSDPDTQAYIEELFKQLIILIISTGFRDVKYDNIPLDVLGNAQLIDYDTSNSPDTGLSKGTTKKQNEGIFNYIPTKFFESFFHFAGKEYNSREFYYVVMKINDIFPRTENKEMKEDVYNKYCQKNSICFSSQTIAKLDDSIFKDKDEFQLANVIISILNSTLSNSYNFNLKLGRSIYIDTSKIFDLDAKQIWGDTIEYSTDDPNLKSFDKILPSILVILKDNGYIYHSKCDWKSHKLKIIA